MNTPHPNLRPPEPLTPEERELAARLAQLGPRGTPPPALDTRIIAAAHAAAVGRARPRQGRWPALIGLAATLALAIGVTWQMQPGGDVAPRDEVPRERGSVVAIEAAADNAEPTAAPAGKQEPGLTDDVGHRIEDVPMRVPAPATATPDPAPAAVPPPAKAAVNATPAPPPPLPLPLPQQAPPAAPPAPPQSPPVAEQAIDAATPAQAQRETMTRRGPESRSSAAPASMDRATAAGAAAAPDDLAAVPVARDGELEPADWLERIRLRRDAGDLAGARESLRLLRRAHPQTVLPADLRDLAESPADQP